MDAEAGEQADDLWTTQGWPAWRGCPGLSRLAVDQGNWGSLFAENVVSRVLPLIFLCRILQALQNLPDRQWRCEKVTAGGQKRRVHIVRASEYSHTRYGSHLIEYSGTKREKLRITSHAAENCPILCKFILVSVSFARGSDEIGTRHYYEHFWRWSGVA